VTVSRPCLLLLAACIALCFPALARAQATCSQAILLDSSGSYAGNSAGSLGDGATGLCVATSRSVWHRFVPTSTGTHTISLGTSSFNTVASLFSGCSSPLPTVLACDDDSVGDDAVIVYPLVAGQPYFIRVASLGSTPGGTYTLRIVAPLSPSPANDICGTSAVLALNAPASVSTRGALGSGASGCSTLDSADIWFSFNAPAAGVYIAQVCSPIYQPVLSTHGSCLSAVPLQCNVGAMLVPCSPGQAGAALSIPVSNPGTQRLRLAGTRGATGPATIAVYSSQPSDLCEGATTVAIAAPVSGSITPALGTETTVPCAVSGLDAFHRFTPAASGQYVFTTACDSFAPLLSLFSACPSFPGSAVLACSSASSSCVSGSGSTLAATLAAGNTYLIRVAGLGSPAAFGNYILSVNPAAPINDQCSAANVISEGVPVSSSTLGATGIDLSSCGPADTRDVWFAFTPPTTGAYEVNTCGSALSTTLAIFSGCSGSQLACADVTGSFCGPSLQGAGLLLNLSAGVGYRIRVAGFNGDAGPFTLAATRAPARGDVCTSPVTLAQSIEVASTTTSASGTGFPGCAQPDAADIWYAFTPSVTRFYRFSTCGSPGPLALSLTTGCSSTQQLACTTIQPDQCAPNQAAPGLTAFLEAGATYRLRVLRIASTAGGSFRLRVDPASPPNDLCTSPTTITPGDAIVGTTAGATGDTASPCLGIDGPDVWFSITPTQTAFYRLDTCTAAELDTVLGLFESCSMSPVICNDDAPACPAGRSRIVARLLAGQTYLVRIAGKSGTQGAFTLSAAITQPPNDTCLTATSVGEGAYVFETFAATTDSAFVDGVCASALGFNLLSADVWYRYTAIASGTVTVSTCGASFDTALTVSTAAAGCPTGVYAVVACNDNAVCPEDPMAVTPQARTSFPAVAGQTYLIRIGSRFGTGGSGVLTISRVGACACDFDRNGLLRVDDIFAFLAAWFAREPRADFDGNGSFTIGDVFVCLQCFFGRPPGC